MHSGGDTLDMLERFGRNDAIVLCQKIEHWYVDSSKLHGDVYIKDCMQSCA